jgi:hypothetical protein
MPFQRDTSSPGRQSRSRDRPDALQVSAARDADGVLVLYAEGSEPSLRPASTDPMPEDAVLARLRAERDAALEEVAYLEEQLRSLRAYHAHLLDEERRRMFDERTGMATELASLREELQRRTCPDAMPRRSARGPLIMTSDADGAGTP